MDSSELVTGVVHINGQAIDDTESGVIFRSIQQAWFTVSQRATFEEFKAVIAESISNGNAVTLKKIQYRCPFELEDGKVRFRKALIKKDANVELLFKYYRRFMDYVPGIELIVVTEAVGSTSNRFSQQYAGLDLNSYPIDQLCDEASSTSTFRDSQMLNVVDEEFPTGVPEWDANESEDDEGYDEGEEDDDESDCDDEDDGTNSPRNQVPSEPPPFMRTLDLAAMHAPEFPEYAAVGPEYVSGDELQIGMQFTDRKAAEQAIKEYNILKGLDYKVKESEPSTLYFICKQYGDACVWHVRASYRKKKGIWEITKYNGPHTCTEDNAYQDHPKLDSDMIAKLIKGMIGVDASIKVKVIIEAAASHFGYKPSYRKAWLAKQKAIELVYGNWEESYNELPKWLKALCHIDVGSAADITSAPAYIQNQLSTNDRYFERVFWTFRSCVKAFRYCKPLVQIDGTHLYGKYKGTLLVAVAQDGNRNIVPIGFAIVEGETADAWQYFLTNLRKYVVSQDGVALISDRHVSILAAIERCGGEWKPPRAYHMFCLRHIAANFLRNFKKPYLNQIVISMGYARTQREFTYHYNRLAEHGDKYTKWIDDIKKEQWAQVFDEGRRYGHMTTNLVECINSTLKGARNLPITALVRTTHWRLVQLFSDKKREIKAEINAGNKFAKDIMQRIRVNQRESTILAVLEHDRQGQIFVVRDNSKDYRVEMRRLYCDCGNFQIDRYPCRHAIACCSRLGLNWEAYVDDVYNLARIYNVYERPFKAIGHEDTWPCYSGPRIHAHPDMLRKGKGRPKSTRFLNEMDSRMMRRRKHCSLCKQPGHRRSQCPNDTT